MRYDWIEKYLTKKRASLSSPYYRDILIGQISLTDGGEKDSLLKYTLPFYGGFQPNDGFQLLRDTYFGIIGETIQAPSLVLIHEEHIEIKHSYKAFANIASFIEAKQRVRITLDRTTVTNIHESISSSNRGSEIVFASTIDSPKAYLRWDNSTLDERLYESGALTIYNYPKDGSSFSLNQILFDGFVLKEESVLEVTVEGFEIDRSRIYNISEINKVSTKESLGKATQTVPLKEGNYTITGKDWSGELKVEVLKM